MSEQKHTQVLIVGAGPTGLATGALLAKLGVRVRLIDKTTARTDKSKALGVQAGTLECLAKALSPDVPQQMIASGKTAKEACFHLDQKPPIKVDFSSIPSQHNFVLILEQSETERILEEYLNTLGVFVERSTELVTLEDRESHVVTKIKNASGADVDIASDFLIGCDGAHSSVRHQLQIPFVGDAYEGTFILGDVEVGWPWPYDSIRTFVSKHGVIASFPMKGTKRYRLILIPKAAKEFGTASREISFDEFRAIVSSMSDDYIRVSNPVWLTRFRVHHRIVQSFQKGRAFLAGDAAHIHSPVGGQGMNTGIQDGLNLAFKLKRVLSGDAELSLLENYQKERLPIAKGVLRSTDFAFRMALLPETRLTAFIRSAIAPRIIASSWIQKKVVAAISEASVARKEIARYIQ